jgi:hypothetical protein
MPQTVAFGRRGAGPAPPDRVATPERAAPTQQAAQARPPASTGDLSPEAEAFRAELVASRGGGSASFTDWRRSNDWERWLMIAVRTGAFLPGVVTLVIDAPLELSIGLELAAFAGNMWYRYVRRRRLRDIVAWRDPSEAG